MIDSLSAVRGITSSILGNHGEAEETQESVNDLIATFSIAVLAIYFLLVLLFNSFLQAIMVALAIPFGLIGVIFAFAFHGEPFGFLAMLGVIGLAGVVVNDSLVLVNHINTLRQDDPEAPVKDIVARATGDRLTLVLIPCLYTIGADIRTLFRISAWKKMFSPKRPPEPAPES